MAAHTGARLIPVLEDKVVVVTGGTSGIGAQIATLFVEERARVVIAGRRRDKGEQLAQSLGKAAMFVRADVTVEADVKAMIEHAVGRFGRLDCLINNAGTGSQHVGIPDIVLRCEHHAPLFRCLVAGERVGNRVARENHIDEVESMGRDFGRLIDILGHND
jgi:NAD(P)-dependent dehydrogenase (short-subunit alcohol dehydrogenase family)